MDAVVFDLDGTLAVPERDRATILRAALAAAGAPAIPREAYVRAHREHLTAETRTPVFETLFAERGVDADPEAAARAYRERLTAALRPVDGVEALLADLRGTYRTGLLTNGPVRAQGAKLDALGWWERFDAVAITGELAAGKPDPRAFEAVLAELGVDPGDAAYVGNDPETDVRGATRAGLWAVQVLEPGEDPVPAADAATQRSELGERLPAILDSLEP